MTSGRRAVVWSPLDRPGSEPPEAEGLRQRKKRLLRQQLSDTATQMFMERGFDDVRVSEVAEACQVSEKTVFNYFPTKESLILDRWDATMASLPAALADPEVSPVEATLRVLAGELGDMTSWLASQDDPIQAGEEMRRFDRLIWSTPSLRAYQRDMTDRLAAAAAGVLAERVGMSLDDPEPQVAANALLGLWLVQFQSLTRCLDGVRTPAQVHEAVKADVRRAAQVIDTGLSTFIAGPGRTRCSATTPRACSPSGSTSTGRSGS
jgi:AcrR family transcriptional regulator